MGKYQRMTLAVRCQIKAYLQAGFSVSGTAMKLGFHKSSIYRELTRNSIDSKYLPAKASELAHGRQRLQGRKMKITDSLEGIVIEKLLTGWSPEQISGRVYDEVHLKISHQAIYEYVKRDQSLRSSLRRTRKRGAGRYSQRRAKWANKLHISQRPEAANQRERVGDWERDAMYGANKEQLLVCTDRKSKYTKIARMEKLCSRWVSLTTKKLLMSIGKKVHTITNDNGTEFRGNTDIGIPIYYCTPMTPQQRGTVENTIGLLRQFITRKTDLSRLKKQDIDYLEDLINHRPRKCLDYKTPHEVFYNKSVALVS
jgi:IS30 family transposase